MDLAVDVKYIAHVRSFSNPRDRCRVSQNAKILSNVNHQSSAFTNKTKKKSLIENNTCCDVRNRLFFFFLLLSNIAINQYVLLWNSHIIANLYCDVRLDVIIKHR